MVSSFGLLIGGAEVPSLSGATFDSLDPSSGEVVATCAQAGRDDVDAAVAAAGAAWPDWAQRSAADRGSVLQAVSTAILANAEDLSRLEARDCGKVMSQARHDVHLAARYFSFFGGVVSALHGEQLPLGADVLNVVTREPHGVCAQINAWNFPLNMAARSLAPALAAGNTVVVKTAELAPATTAVLGRLLTEVGLPPGVVNVVHGTGSGAGAALSGHPDVDLITFTGSVATGRIVATSAAANVTPCVLELGGKSPTIVFDDADVGEVADRLAEGFVEANGQSCDLPSLALVQSAVHDEFVERLVTRLQKVSVGPPLADADVGPLISERQRARVESYVDGALRDGARAAFGPGRPTDPALARGWYVNPTVLVDVRPEMAIAREEVFGPVLGVIPFRDEDDAIRLAGSSGYGLAAFVWSRDVGRGLRVARRVRAGQVYVNCFQSGDSVATPFGGFGASGYGREKGFEALRTYTRTKNLCVSMR
jgi:aldehyde dehydrogenase (NAD+)